MTAQQDQHPLTYEDGYREGLAAQRTTASQRARSSLQAAHRVPESYPDRRTAHLLEAIAWALLASAPDQQEQS